MTIGQGPDEELGDSVEVRRATRKDIVDWLSVEGIDWSGRLNEEAFLDRFVNLDELASTDPRYPTARYDLRQHRVNNYDWDDDWVYTYEPLDLLGGDSGTFLRFLRELVHPVVRPEAEEARRLARELNDLLATDGVELFESGSIGDRPTFGARRRRGTRAPRGRTHDTSSTKDNREPEVAHRLWKPGMLRLFLSHVSSHKAEVGALKAHLRVYGVDCFVAHEDIEPTLEWQGEIEEALRSMHALAALLTEDFHQSNWTDHEAGIALGLGVLVIPIRLPANPYGFFGKIQGLKGDLATPADLSSRIVDVLLRNPATAAEMRSGLATAMEGSTGYSISKIVLFKLINISGKDPVVADRLESSIASNAQVRDAFGVPERLREIASRLRGA